MNQPTTDMREATVLYALAAGEADKEQVAARINRVFAQAGRRTRVDPVSIRNVVSGLVRQGFVEVTAGKRGGLWSLSPSGTSELRLWEDVLGRASEKDEG